MRLDQVPSNMEYILEVGGKKHVKNISSVILDAEKLSSRKDSKPHGRTLSFANRTAKSHQRLFVVVKRIFFTLLDRIYAYLERSSTHLTVVRRSAILVNHSLFARTFT